VNEDSCQAKSEYGGFALGQLIIGCLIANAIPFFDSLLGLIGGLLSAPISFGFPVLFYLGALARLNETSNSGGGVVPSVGDRSFGGGSGLEEEERRRSTKEEVADVGEEQLGRFVVASCLSSSYFDEEVSFNS
jgi:hypothetical protein